MSERIWSYVTETEYTVYGAWKVYAEVLEAVGEKVPPSQMMYNYARQGMLVKGQKLTKETMRKLTAEEVAIFVVRMITKKGHQVPSKATKVEIATVTEPTFISKDELVQL